MEDRPVFDLLASVTEATRARELTDRLLASFLTCAGVFEAPRDLLMREGLTAQEADVLHAVPDFARSLDRTASPRRARIRCVRDAVPVLTDLFLGKRREEFCVLCLGDKGELVSLKALGAGTADRAPAYVRNVLAAASESGCRVLIAAHNHPGGTRAPSTEDVSLTLRILSSLCPIGVTLVDHLIFSDGGVTSIRLCGFLSDDVWRAQNFPAPFYGDWT